MRKLPASALELCWGTQQETQSLSGWYEAETGLDNPTLLASLEGEQSDYVMINHARWGGSLPVFMGRQLPKRTFRSYMLANLKARHLAAMPVLCHLA